MVFPGTTLCTVMAPSHNFVFFYLFFNLLYFYFFLGKKVGGGGGGHGLPGPPSTRPLNSMCQMILFSLIRSNL